MSSSSPEPDLTVVVASNGAAGAVASCLTALQAQVDGVEVLVCEPSPSGDDVRRAFPWATFHVRAHALVPELWRDGIDVSRGSAVALTISPMRPADDWIDTVRVLLGRFDAVGGAVEPGSRLRLVDWAEYFCRYARDMLPFAGHESVDLPGDNAVYARAALEGTHELYRDGFWEPVVHRRLAADGGRLWHAPELVVYQGRSAGARAFAGQRARHGRVYGRQRGGAFGRARNVLGVVAAPLVPAVLVLRRTRQVFRKRRHRARFALTLPLLVAFDAAWAAGEALGHLDCLRAR